MEITTLYNMVTLTPHQNQPNTQYAPWQYGLPEDRPVPVRIPPIGRIAGMYIHATSTLERGSARVQNGRVSTRGTNMCGVGGLLFIARMTRPEINIHVF